MSGTSYNPEPSFDLANDSCSSCGVDSEPQKYLILDDDDDLSHELCSRCKFVKEIGKECVKHGIFATDRVEWGYSPARWSDLTCIDDKPEAVRARWFEVFTLPGLSSFCSSPGLRRSIACVLTRQPGSPKPFPEFPERLPLGSTKSAQTLAQVQHWLDVCQRSHTICTPEGQETSKLPKRLMDVSSSQVRLCEPSVEESASYVCLSHCWGGVEPLCKTTTTTIESNKRGIGWDAMPKTFQDAIDFTRRLDVKYIWIDSMCIIQDDSQDWAEQSACMTSVYEHAHLAICATASKSDDGGLYSVLSPRLQPRRLRIVKDSGTTYDIYIRTDPHLQHVSTWSNINDRFSQHLPLMTRAWGFQERLLSPRLVHFAEGEVMWECSELSACQCVQGDPDEPHEYMSDDSKWVFRQILRGDGSDSTKQYWKGIVESYSCLALTLDKDKLPAISGVAKKIASIRDGDRYLAGLWEKSIISDLRWQVYSGDHVQRLTKWRAPSWSWTSINAPTLACEKEDGSEKREYARYIEASVTPTSADPTGELSSGYLVLDAPVISARVKGRTNPQPGFRWELVANSFATTFFADCEADFEDGSLALDDMLLCVRLKQCKYYAPPPDEGSKDFGLVLKQRGTDGTTALYERVGWFSDDATKFEKHWFTSETKNQLVKIV